MSTFLYDEALVQKIRGWTSTTDTMVLGVNESTRLFEIIGDKNEDKPIKLPLITLSRSRGYNIINNGTTRRPLSYDGASYNRHIYNENTSSEYSTEDVINAIPISLSYQLDVYTRYAQEADILMRNLVFNIVNYPAMTIVIPKANFEHVARITLNDTIEDNSDIPERFVTGNITRLSCIISIDDAYLWDPRELHDVNIDFIINDSETWKWSEKNPNVVDRTVTETVGQYHTAPGTAYKANAMINPINNVGYNFKVYDPIYGKTTYTNTYPTSYGLKVTFLPLNIKPLERVELS